MLFSMPAFVLLNVTPSIATTALLVVSIYPLLITALSLFIDKITLSNMNTLSLNDPWNVNAE